VEATLVRLQSERGDMAARLTALGTDLEAVTLERDSLLAVLKEIMTRRRTSGMGAPLAPPGSNPGVARAEASLQPLPQAGWTVTSRSAPAARPAPHDDGGAPASAAAALERRGSHTSSGSGGAAAAAAAAGPVPAAAAKAKVQAMFDLYRRGSGGGGGGGEAPLSSGDDGAVAFPRAAAHSTESTLALTRPLVAPVGAAVGADMAPAADGTTLTAVGDLGEAGIGGSAGVGVGAGAGAEGQDTDLDDSGAAAPGR
jgi:hypothetical protein